MQADLLSSYYLLKEWNEIPGTLKVEIVNLFVVLDILSWT